MTYTQPPIKDGSKFTENQKKAILLRENLKLNGLWHTMNPQQKKFYNDACKSGYVKKEVG